MSKVLAKDIIDTRYGQTVVTMRNITGIGTVVDSASRLVAVDGLTGLGNTIEGYKYALDRALGITGFAGLEVDRARAVKYKPGAAMVMVRYRRPVETEGIVMRKVSSMDQRKVYTTKTGALISPGDTPVAHPTRLDFLSVTMNVVVQDRRNSLLHREVRYGESARFDGRRIGKPARFS